MWKWWRINERCKNEKNKRKEMGAEIDDRLNCRIPCHSFTCHWIRIASIVLSLVLESLTTHINEVDQSGRVFWSYSIRPIRKKTKKYTFATTLTSCYINCDIQQGKTSTLMLFVNYRVSSNNIKSTLCLPKTCHWCVLTAQHFLWMSHSN